MKLIVCVDNSFGIMFNNRRISQDEILRKEIIKILNGKTLFMSEYSKELFEKISTNISVVDPQDVGLDDYYFLEDQDISGLSKISEIILCKWNREYPSDVKFTYDFSKLMLARFYSIKGKSHPKITIEFYK